MLHLHFFLLALPFGQHFRAVNVYVLYVHIASNKKTFLYSCRKKVLEARFLLLITHKRKQTIFFYYYFSLLKGSVHTWNKVSQIYLGCEKKHILLIHFGEMFIIYQVIMRIYFDQNVKNVNKG